MPCLLPEEASMAAVKICSGPWPPRISSTRPHRRLPGPTSTKVVTPQRNDRFDSLDELDRRGELPTEEISSLVGVGWIALAGRVGHHRELAAVHADLLQRLGKGSRGGCYEVTVEGSGNRKTLATQPLLLEQTLGALDLRAGSAQYHLRRRIPIGDHQLQCMPIDECLSATEVGFESQHRTTIAIAVAHQATAQPR